MSNLAKNTKATVIPCLRYRNAPAAIEWLCRAFGFEKHLVVPGDGETIAHAELSFGNGMIMLSSVKESEFDRLMKQPDEIGGLRHRLPTSSCRMQTRPMRERRPPVPKSRWISRTRITVAGAFHVAILKDVSGISALMIRGLGFRLEDALKQEEKSNF
jgi:hypothetical protein